MRTELIAEDEELMQRIAHGDRAAFAELFDRYAPKIKGLIVSIVGDFADADDVVQESFYYVWTAAKNYNPSRGKPLAWIAMLARSRALDAARRRKRAHTSSTMPVEETETVPAAGPAPHELAGSAEISRRLRAALARLPAEQADLVLKSYLGGLNHEELAAELQLPLGTVKTRIRRGILRLREILGNSETFAT